MKKLGLWSYSLLVRCTVLIIVFFLLSFLPQQGKEPLINKLTNIYVDTTDLSLQATFEFSVAMAQSKWSISEDGILNVVFAGVHRGDFDEKAFLKAMMDSGLVQEARLTGSGEGKDAIVLSLRLAHDKALIRQEPLIESGEMRLTLEIYYQDAFKNMRNSSDGPLYVT